MTKPYHKRVAWPRLAGGILAQILKIAHENLVSRGVAATIGGFNGDRNGVEFAYRSY